jgi:phospholipid/cholesterol/gamma-HCH transport system ATP-binding protein
MSTSASKSAPTAAPALVVRGLTIGWGDSPLIEEITFTVSRGEIFAILGGSGSGKSTLLRFLVGLESPTKGAIDIAGVGPPDLEQGLPPFGVMFQGGALFGSMTVIENVALPLEEWTRLPRQAVRAIAAAKLHLVGLENAADKLPAEISGGMTKRAAIARALALDPALAFLDEPAAGLDPVTAAALDDLIVTLSRSSDLTVVVVTHELRSIFAIADRCVLLDKESKRVIAAGDPRALRDSDDPRIHAFFNPVSQRKERSWQPPRTT